MALVSFVSAVSAERKPLSKPEWDVKVVGPTREFIGVNPETGEEMYYDSHAEIEFDAESGNYLLRWNSLDGEKKFEATWEPKTNVDAMVEADVRCPVNTDLYEYRYVLVNSGTSKQKVQSFIVHCLSPATEAGAPDDGWYSRQLPEYVWHKTLWAWADTKYTREGIHPGHSQRGFWVRSRGLPTIVDCYAAGCAPTLHTLEELPTQISTALHAKMGLLANGVSGVTVGPGQAPTGAKPSTEELLEKMLGYTTVSLEQGWIETPKVAEQFLRFLSSAKETAARGDNDKATQALRSVIDEAERQTSLEKKGLTSEAYALLKFNASYLLDRLQSNPTAPAPQ